MNVNILVFAQCIQRDICITYHADVASRQLPWFSAEFAGSELKDAENSSFLKSAYATGATPEEALSDLTKEIKGKWLVFDVTSKDRIKYFVPTTLYYSTEEGK